MSKWKTGRKGSIGRSKGDLDIRWIPGPPLGPGVVTADYRTVLAALERFDPELPWKKARERILPMLPRARPLPGPGVDLARAILPPGILVAFGIDVGPAITFVGSPLLDRWRVDIDEVAAASLVNLRSLARACEPETVITDRIGAVPVTLVQTRLGIAGSLILVPDCLHRLIGGAPRLLLAPMRDILIALPPDVDRLFAAWLAEEWEALDPNHLHLGGFRFESGMIVPEALDEVLARA